jgi:hypothetical protein
MNQFFARMNRGIILGAVLVIGLAGYFVYDARAFEGEAYAVRDTIVGFVDEVRAINTLLAAGGEDDEMLQTADAFLSRFFTEYRHPMWHSGIHSSRQSAEEGLDMLITGSLPLTLGGVSLTLSEISNIQKQAANAVRVQFIMEADRGNRPDALFFNGFMAFSSDRMGNDRLSIDALMLRVDGAWRFATASVRSGSIRTA